MYKKVSYKINKSIKTSVIILLILLMTIFIFMGIQTKNALGHSSHSHPMELYSLWNDSGIIIDGTVEFNATDLGSEWSSAAIYDMFDFNNIPESKLLMQNDDSTFYIGIDALQQQIDPLATTWGASVYFDIDHNGLLSSIDRAFQLIKNGVNSHLIYYFFDTNTDSWIVLESNTFGAATPSGIVGDVDFRSSSFEITPHRQFEFKIPFTVINGEPGKIIGASFETFENFNTSLDEVTWPFIGANPALMRTDASTWGDLYFGEELQYSQYSIEANFNIKESAIGPNNGCFLSTGDIDGDLEDELIVVSNRSVTDDNNLISIYKYIEDELVQIWNSWTSIHYTKLFPIKNTVTNDFDNDDKDEIYGVGYSNKIIKLADWNSSINEFTTVETIFSHTHGLMGYISLGDATNDGSMNIVVGDQTNNIIILSYDSDLESLSEHPASPIETYTSRYWFFLWWVYVEAENIHAIDIDDIDNDGRNEILAFLQVGDDDAISTTELNIYEITDSSSYLNPEDNLPTFSNTYTQDNFGHTIITEDVDNDLQKEIILVGKNYLRIFSFNNLDNPAPLEISINDGSNPQMGGGAFVDDIDQDGYNELVLGFNNGTLMIMNITDSGGDSLSYSVEWSNDLGSIPGKRGGIIAYDIDDDSEKEIIFSDYFGQIFILGKSLPPEIEILSPSLGSTSAFQNILVTWSATDDFAIHHFDIYVEDLFVGRTSGSQIGYFISLVIGNNDIEIIAFDVNGKNSSAFTSVNYSLTAPEVHILTPENYFETSSIEIIITYSAFDINGDFDHYDIWVNDVKIFENIIETTNNITLTNEGINNITIIGVDLATNEGKSTIFVIRDTTGPYIEIISPQTNSATNKEKITVNWVSYDSLTDIGHFDVYLNDLFYTTTIEKSLIINLTSDKEFDITIYAFDELENQNSDGLIITRDTIRPKVEFISPTSGAFFEELLFSIYWQASDNLGGTGIHHTEITVNQKPMYYGTSEFTLINFESEGLKSVIITTYDQAGNFATDYLSLIIDTSSPYISITYPTDNYTTAFTEIPLSWVASDSGSGLKEYNIFVNGLLTETIDDVTTTETMVDIPSDQSSLITLQAVDKMNKTYNNSITVNHDSTYPTINILDPISFYSYSYLNTRNISWAIAGISDLVRFEIYRNNTLIGNHTDTSIRDFTVNLGNYSIDEYYAFNITIYAITSVFNYLISDTRFFFLDQKSPDIIIDTPENNTNVFDQGLFVQWISSDSGSGINEFIISINDEIILRCTCDKTFVLINFNQGDGNFSIKITSFDKAQNNANSSINIVLFLYKPQFTANMPSVIYTKTGIFSFNFSVTNPGFGVKKIFVKLDGNNIYNESYGENIRFDPFWLMINLTTDDYNLIEESHALELHVMDIFNREEIEPYLIYIDTENPKIINSLQVDGKIIENGSTNILIDSNNPDANNHTFTITVSDNYAISSVELVITGDGFNDSFNFLMVEASRVVVSTYSLEINLMGYSFQDYNFTIIINDYAGNKIESEFTISLSGIPDAPWYGKIENLIYLSAAIVFFIILVTVLSITAQKTRLNKNWKDDLIAVLMINTTGLTCAYVPYSLKIIQDEQLIGGVMISIQTILEELAYKKDKGGYKTLQFGDTSLIVFTSKYVIGSLLVSHIKPKHKTLLQLLTKSFEKKYQDSLTAVYYIDGDSFKGSDKLIQKYFGAVKQDFEVDENELVKKLSESNQEYQQKELEHQAMTQRLIDTIGNLTLDKKQRFTRVIELIPKAIISLTERRINDAEKEANNIAQDLNYLLEVDQVDTEFKNIIQNMFNILKEIIYGTETLKNNNTSAYETAIRNATRIWFEEIAEKVS